MFTQIRQERSGERQRGRAVEDGKKPLTPQIAERLLHLLSTDDEFRDRFKSDPTTTLMSLGHAVSSEAICGPVRNLASKDEFANSREELKSCLVRTGIFTRPHCFEAGKNLTLLRRK